MKNVKHESSADEDPPKGSRISVARSAIVVGENRPSRSKFLTGRRHMTVNS